LVEEEEGLSFVDLVVNAYRFALSTWADRDIGIAFLPKDAPYTVKLVVPMFRHIHTGSECRGLGEKFGRGPRVQDSVIYVGWRVGSCFRLSHLEES